MKNKVHSHKVKITENQEGRRKIYIDDMELKQVKCMDINIQHHKKDEVTFTIFCDVEYREKQAMIKKYRSKPCEIEAIQWTGENLEEIENFAKGRVEYDEIRDGYGQMIGYAMLLQTLDGTMFTNYGDYIIKDFRGEFYPCKPDVFEKKYEVIE